MSKRKRSAIKKSKAAILAAANNLEKAGVDCSRKLMIIGGAKPKLVQQERDKMSPTGRQNP